MRSQCSHEPALLFSPNVQSVLDLPQRTDFGIRLRLHILRRRDVFRFQTRWTVPGTVTLGKASASRVFVAGVLGSIERLPNRNSNHSKCAPSVLSSPSLMGICRPVPD